MPYPELFVLRHGQTEWNKQGRHQGRLDSPLTELGQQQARRQREILRPFIVSANVQSAFVSPQGRALETAEIALKKSGLSAISDERLCEIGFGLWEGKTKSEIEAGWPHINLRDEFLWHFQAPDGESFDQISSRVGDFLKGLSEPAILIAHGITSRILRGLWLGRDLDGMREIGGGQGCVCHLRDGGQFLLR